MSVFIKIIIETGKSRCLLVMPVNGVSRTVIINKKRLLFVHKDRSCLVQGHDCMRHAVKVEHITRGKIGMIHFHLFV